MYNFGYQRQRTGGGTIANGEAIEFNNQLVNFDQSITYDSKTFTLSNNADYYVSWYVTLKSGLGVNGPTISLITNQNPAVIYPSTNSMKTGQISGSAVIRTGSNTTFQLVNKTGQSIVLASNVNVTANISIIQINSDRSGIDLKLTNSAGSGLLGGAAIPFDTIFTQYNDLITNTDGVVAIKTPSKYIVDWSISLEGSLDAASIKFDLVNIIGTDSSTIGISESPVGFQGTMYGSAIVNASNASLDDPYLIQLINASENEEGNLTELTLANIGIQASMRIVQV